MCVIVVLYQVIPGYPLMVGANRDEFYQREAEAPHRWPSLPPLVAGRDLRAGGTWLGVNAHGLVVGVTNRRRGRPYDPSRRSRGLLCLDALLCSSADEMRVMLGERDLQAYNGFNLFYADAKNAYVTHWCDRSHTVPLKLGHHVITNDLDVNEEANGRVRAAREMLARRNPSDARTALTTLQELCRTRGNAADPLESLCVETETYGTVSSTVLAVPEEGRPWVFLHAEGNPTRTEYKDLSSLFPLTEGQEEQSVR